MAYGLKELILPNVAVAGNRTCRPGASESDAKPVGTVFLSILYGSKLYEYRAFFEPRSGLDEEECKEDIMLRTVGYMVEKAPETK